MNPKLPNTSHLPTAPNALDRVLLDDAILPSSGFAASVIGQIADCIAAETAQASAPAPIPFPWKLALPTLAAVAIALIAAIRLVTGIRHSVAGRHDLFQFSLSQLHGGAVTAQALPAIAAIAGSLLCLLFTRYLAPGRSSH